MQETQEMRSQSLGQEDPLEREMATHSSILAWRILWTEESGGLQSMGLQRIRHDWTTEHMFALSYSEHVFYPCEILIVIQIGTAWLFRPTINLQSYVIISYFNREI